MSRYNTDNPIGSADPRDRDDNSKNLDVAVNTEADSWTDRFGNERVSLAGAFDPSGFAQTALDEADRATAARDAAFVNADVYDDVDAGLEGTSDGEQFQLVEGDEVVRYRNDDDEAVEVARYPSADQGRRGAAAYNTTENRLGLTDLARQLGPQATLVAPVQLGWVWQDLGKTVPATQAGDPVRVIGDQSGRGNDITMPGNNLPVLGRDGVNVWVEGKAGDSSWLMSDDSWDVYRDKFGIQFCVGWDYPFDTSARFLIARDRQSSFQVNYSGGQSGRFDVFTPAQEQIRTFRARRTTFPEAVSATFDWDLKEFRAYFGEEFYSEDFYADASEEDEAETTIRDMASAMPVLLFADDEDVGGRKNETDFRFYGMTVVARPLTQSDHDAFQSTVEPAPLHSVEIPRMASRLNALSVLESQVETPFSLVRRFYDSHPGFFIRPTKRLCFQDLAMQVPVESSGDPVRVILSQSDFRTKFVALSDESSATYQTDGKEEWLHCDGGAHYIASGPRAVNRNDVFFAVRTHASSAESTYHAIVSGFGESSSSESWIAIWRSAPTDGYQMSTLGVDQRQLNSDDDPGDVVFAANLTGYDSESPSIEAFKNGELVVQDEPSLTDDPEGDQSILEFLVDFEGRFYGAMLCQPALTEPQRQAAEQALRLPLLRAAGIGSGDTNGDTNGDNGEINYVGTCARSVGQVDASIPTRPDQNPWPPVLWFGWTDPAENMLAPYDVWLPVSEPPEPVTQEQYTGDAVRLVRQSGSDLPERPDQNPWPPVLWFGHSDPSDNMLEPYDMWFPTTES